MKKLFSIMPKVQNHYCFKLYFQKVYERIGGKWLIRGSTRAIICKALNSPVEHPSRESKHDINEPKVACSIQYSKWTSRDSNIQGGA